MLKSFINHIASKLGFIIKRRRPGIQRASGNEGDHKTTMTAQQLMHQIHGQNIYENFEYDDYSYDPHGWGGESEAFLEIILKTNAKFVIEVGTWKGASALTMSNLLKEHFGGGTILCIDTWLGALEFWENLDDPERFKALKCQNGYPQVYYTFLANVCHAGHQDTIVPFPLHSSSAALWLLRRRIYADAIYIDASHEEEDVFQDLLDYYDIVKPGGILFGDDWKWDGVRNAVKRFSKLKGLQTELLYDKWIIEKK